MFTEGLLAAYPDAKVLITNRDEDTWIWSVSSLFNTLLGWNWGLMAPYDPIDAQPYIEILTIVWDQWTAGDWNDAARLRQTFRDHYALVQATVPADRLLEFNPKGGLGVPVQASG
ncbi:MAG: hypothetical protein ALECFALPRED_001153 [Alectoria fallacina]|uniref:Sulfotransferase n=1 Tax=Alectoria fallacina TaxID=1903189 RepID=A0A8H3PKQ7_9LECA|nr:MAG: hypothetical protein ALECFALPRED_001153 [Alectoria fallacina]